MDSRKRLGAERRPLVTEVEPEGPKPYRQNIGYVGLPRTYSRKAERTDLSTWMEKTGKTAQEVARLMGVSTNSIRLWAAGKAVPSLVAAYRLEVVTEYKVTMLSWMSTRVGRRLWEGLEAVAEVA